MLRPWKRKPTVSRYQEAGDVETFDDMMKNRFFKVILVAAMANVGALAGTFLSIYIIWQRLGLINPTELLKELFRR